MSNPISKVENRDGLAAMREFPDKHFDLCFTDPPFGVRSDYWDSMSEQEFTRFTMAWLSEAKRVSKNILLFCNDGNILETLMNFLFPNVRKALWHKPLGSQYAGSSEAKMFFSYETILFGYETADLLKTDLKIAVASLIKKARERAGLSKGAVDIAIRGKKTGLCYRWEEGACLPTKPQVDLIRELINLDEEFDATIYKAYDSLTKSAEKPDVFIYRTVVNGIHPCQKPVELLIDLLQTFAEPKSKILDTFVGSGSSRIAAYDLGFDFYGYELGADYFAAQEKRFAEHIAQPRLFEPVRREVKQEGLFG